MARTYRRRRPTPATARVADMHPLLAVDLADTAALSAHRTSRTMAVVCTGGGTVLLGLNSLARSRRLRADTIEAWQIDCTADEASTIAAADALNATQSQMIAAIALLRGKGIPSVAIAGVLGIEPWAVSRLAAAASTGERLATALAKAMLPLTHTRLLAKLPAAEQSAWTERAIAGRWSFRRLERALREAEQPPALNDAPDLGAFASQLAERLGTEVRLEWPDDPSRRFLALAWYGPEDLKGLLAQLAAGPEATPAKPNRRELVLQVASADELDSLTGHLVQL